MLYGWLANLILLAHLTFIVFVALGGVVVLRWPRLAWLHLPCVVWGVMVELLGWVCPLTPWENHFRRLAGQAGYEGDFIQHYLLAAIYPDGLTRNVQIMLGLALVVINLAFYGLLLCRARSRAG
jgi:hypothetical protein